MSTPSEPTQGSPSERLRVGECRVDVPLREIHAPGARRPTRITPKAMGVLLVLAEQPGRVVSRDTLFSRVWPDTLPTNDVLTQAVTQLRKAFGEERGDPRYVETIAKTGYRLLAPVEWDAAGASDTGTRPEPVPAALDGVPGAVAWTPDPHAAMARRPNWAAWASALAIATLLALVAVLWLRPGRDAGEPAAAAPAPASDLPRPDYRLITSAPGFEGAPSLSPDAAMVAYVALPSGQRNTAIMVQTTDPSPPRQLTQPPPGADDMAPAWSPNGRELAFLRIRAGQDCAVMVQPANGGGVGRRVGRCDPDNRPGFDWTPDGRGLIFSSRGTLGDDRGLRVLDLASGAWKPIEYAASASDIDASPKYSPDGRWIVFVRNPPFGDFWRLPAMGGTAMRLSEMRGDIGEWDFTPDGRSLVFARWRHSESRLYRLDIDTGLVRDLGISDGDQPAIAARAPALAFSQQRNVFGLYRVDLAGEAAPERLFPSSGRDRLPAIAPDDRQLAFASDRSGQFGLWWADLERPDSLRLIDGILPESRHLPEWSPDSERLLVVGNGRDDATSLYEVSPASGRMARLELPEGEPVQGAYSPADAGRLYVVAGTGGGRVHLTLYDRSASPWRALASIEDVAAVRVDASRERVLFTRPGRPGMWQAGLDLAPASIRLVSGTRPVVIRYRQWNVAADGRVLLIDRGPGCAARLTLLEPPADDRLDASVDGIGAGEAGAAPIAGRCLETSRLAATTAFSVAPGGRAAYVSLSETLGGDIGFMTLPLTSEALWPGANK